MQEDQTESHHNLFKMKTILIDGNNLIHKIPSVKALFLKDKNASRLALLETIKSKISRTDKLIIVFDGHGSSKKADIIYSENITADEIIRKKIEAFGDYKKLKVVSSDYGITNLAKECGCEVMKSEDFWKSINKTIMPAGKDNINQNYIYDKPETMSRKDFDEYKKHFT